MMAFLIDDDDEDACVFCAQLVSQWLWLSHRFSPKQFVGRARVEKLEASIVERMKSALACMSARGEGSEDEEELELQGPSRRLGRQARRQAKKRARQQGCWVGDEEDDFVVS